MQSKKNSQFYNEDVLNDYPLKIHFVGKGSEQLTQAALVTTYLINFGKQHIYVYMYVTLKALIC